MSKHNIPFFEADGTKYEIKRTRYLQAEFDEMKGDLEMTDEEQVAYAKEQDFDDRLAKLRARKDELYEKYLETFDEEDEAKYLKANKAYLAMIDEAGKIESISGKQRKKMLDLGEALVIKALQVDKEGKEIRTYDEAKTIWESFVEESGQVVAIQFVAYFINYILGGDEDVENPFITQAKAKAEQKASMKKGIVKGR
jgi:FMN phosphatase YigB (HAD superfamily)